MNAQRIDSLVIALAILLGVAGIGMAQTPQDLLRRQQMQAFYYPQLAAQQAMYPTPFSPISGVLNFYQFANAIDRTRFVPPVGSILDRSPQIDAILQRSLAVQSAMYPQTMSPGDMPLNAFQFEAGRGLQTPLIRFPPDSEVYSPLLLTQQGTIAYVADTALALPAMLQSQPTGAVQMLQAAAVLQGFKPVAGAKAGGPAMFGRRANTVLALFREAPGERELELGKLWSTVDPEKARSLYFKAIDQSGGKSFIAEQARKELKALDGK